MEKYPITDRQVRIGRRKAKQANAIQINLNLTFYSIAFIQGYP